MALLVFVWAIIPLAMYVLWIGCLQFRSRPTVLSGFVDTIWLGMGISGLMLVGPCELFLPEVARNRFGWMAHLLVLALSALLLILAAVTRNPRIVIYNISKRQLEPTLRQVLKLADAQAVFTGRGATLPTLGLDLFIDLQEDRRTAELRSMSREIDLRYWRQLRLALRDSLRTVQGSSNPRAAVLIGAGLAALALVVYLGITDWPALARGMQQWFDR